MNHPSVDLKGICLLLDNDPSYKRRVVVDFLRNQKVTVNHFEVLLAVSILLNEVFKALSYSIHIIKILRF